MREVRAVRGAIERYVERGRKKRTHLRDERRGREEGRDKEKKCERVRDKVEGERGKETTQKTAVKRGDIRPQRVASCRILVERRKQKKKRNAK